MSNDNSELNYAVKLDKEQKIKLSDYDAGDKGGENKDISAVMLAKLGERAERLAGMAVCGRRRTVF